MTGPIPNCPQPETPIRERAWSDAQITRAARALCKDASDVCGVDNEDNWKFYSEDFRKQAVIALTAAGAAP
ncbi:hypothetical protein ACFCQI_01815 [Rhodanobacter sp. FW102-FHT14D06]|uniref:Uncharacterized protein n=2 Tax=unclassified Rhodanobacter TaxID=2621553 RepID=A0AB74UWR5_9GAMM